MNYKNIFILLSILLFSCVDELNVTDFSDNYSEYERELRIEAVMFPASNSAIIRIDQSLLITDDSLFDCVDNNGNWVASGCVCGEEGGFSIENCPEDSLTCVDDLNGDWELSLIGTTSQANEMCELAGEPEGCLDYVCILDNLTEEECSHDVYDFNWEIIDDVGTDGLPGDPTDENENCEPDELSDENSPCLTEPSEGEGNGVTDCGEPNVDDLEEITEYSDIHLTDDECLVKIIRSDNEECEFEFNEAAGSMYNASGLIGFSNGTGCQSGDEIVLTQDDLDNLSYDYGAWVPNLGCEDYIGTDEKGFFEKRDASYELYINCNNQIITSKDPEKIPYPAIFVNPSDVNEDAIGSCAIGSESEIHDCLESNEFKLNDLQTFIIDEDNYLTYIATSKWYQAIQYNDPFNNSCNNGSLDEDTWYYYHGHFAVAYPPSSSTNHFPPYPETPTIYTSEEEVVSDNSFVDSGCYRYEILTFSEGYQKYYFSQLDLKDPERSNLRTGNQVVMGAFGAINSTTIDFTVE